MERQRKARGQVSPDKATPPPPIRHEFEVLVRIKFVKRDPQRRSAPESVVVKSALRWLSPFYVEGSGE